MDKDEWSCFRAFFQAFPQPSDNFRQNSSADHSLTADFTMTF
jgi:hypothetical protein